MPQISPPFIPTIGVGAPGVNVPRNMPYIDVAGAAGVYYIYHNLAWRICGTAGTFDATSIQGVTVSATPPIDGDVLTYDGSDWIGQ